MLCEILVSIICFLKNCERVLWVCVYFGWCFLECFFGLECLLWSCDGECIVCKGGCDVWVVFVRCL